MTAFLLLGLLACGQPDPMPLPQPVRAGPTVEARMVRMGAVTGWLARPLAAPPGAKPGTLVLVEAIDDQHKQAARGLAEAGRVVLVVDAAVDAAAAHAYLAGMPDVGSVEQRCERADCAPATP